MPQLILVIILLVLYFLLIRFLFVSVGPTFIYVVSLVLSSAVPVAYVYTLVGVYGRDGGSPKNARNWFLAPVVVLVGLIYLDMLLLALRVSLPILSTSLGMELYRVLLGFVNGGAVGVGQLALPEENRWLLSAAIKSTLIVPCLLGARGLRSQIENPRQPAFLAYFQAQALRDLQATIVTTSTKLSEGVLFVHGLIMKGTMGPQAWFVWPLTIMAYVALVPPILIGAVMTLMFLILHAATLGLLWLLAMWASLLLTSTENAVIRARAGYVKCPHASCHKPIPLPIFMCPHCGIDHDRLIPGRFGVLVRACKCGSGRMPTLFWLGKAALRSKCPVCKNPLRKELFAESAHIPIYGGTSTGKTTYMMACSWELLEGKVAGVKTSLIEETSQRTYSSRWKPDFESGRAVDKTTKKYPDAFLLGLQRGGGLAMSVYLYDPAGEAMVSQVDLGAHRFIEYVDGLALLIDPLSLASFRATYQRRGGPDVSLTTSTTDPEEIVTRVVSQLEAAGTLTRRRGYKRRVAVIFTKSDVAGFAEETGISRTGSALTEDWSATGLDDSEKLRAWLGKNEPRLLQMLETRFSEFRLFAVSSQGHAVRDGQPFAPRGVIPPLAWLLSTRSTIARPTAGRVKGRLSEFAAAAAAALVVVGIPVGVAGWLALR